MTAGSEVLLETDRLVLRWFTPADVDLLVELDSDAAVMPFITGGRATSRAAPSSAGSTSAPLRTASTRSSATGCAGRPDRIEGEEHGDVEYARTRADWASRRAGGR